LLTKASSIWYVDTPDPTQVLRAEHDPDSTASQALARQLHPGFEVSPTMVGTLGGCAGPDVDEVYLGCFPGVTVLCSALAARIHPSAIPEMLVRPLASEHTFLVSFDTVHGWGSFAHWERGELRRAFSSTRLNILEDEGLPLVWERAFWAGEHPVQWRPWDLPDPQTLPFDPPDFANAAGHEWLGVQYRAPAADGELTPSDIPVCGFSLRSKGQMPRAGGPVAGEHSRTRKRGVLSWLRNQDQTYAEE